MKKILSFMAIALSFSAQSVSASTITYTDTMNAAGTQVSVLIQGSGFSNGLGGAGLDMTWDSTVLNVALNLAGAADVQYNTGIYNFSAPPLSITAGSMVNFAPGSFYFGVANQAALQTTNSTFDIGTIIFDVVSQGVTPFSMAVNGNGLNDANLAPIDLVANPVTVSSGNISTVSAVPLPPALLLFGSSLLGLLGVNSRRKA